MTRIDDRTHGRDGTSPRFRRWSTHCTAALAITGILLASATPANAEPPFPTVGPEPVPPRVYRTNLGEIRPMIFEGHRLTDRTALEAQAGGAVGPFYLYAPAEADDPLFRDMLVQLTGGIVDYFDARFDTPPPALLAQYDGVHTWANFPYAQPEAFGNALGTYVAKGKCLVLGYGCLLNGTALAGAVMTPAWCPVFSPTGLPVPSQPYSFDGDTCIFDPLATFFAVTGREDLALQGTGAFDGTFVDGRPAAAFNDAGGGVPSNPRVIYLNGATASTTNDIPCWIANAFLCHGIVVDECPEDINGDERVDFADLLIVLSEWGTPAKGPDLDGDGIVAFGDLLAVLSGWGECSAPG